MSEVLFLAQNFKCNRTSVKNQNDSVGPEVARLFCYIVDLVYIS